MEEYRHFLAGEFDGIGVKREMPGGDPAAQIDCCVKAEKPGLIMLATHGYGTFRRLLKRLDETAFASTARAHKLCKTGDRVILYYEGQSGERQATVVTARQGPLKGLRIGRGREAECEQRDPRNDPKSALSSA